MLVRLVYMMPIIENIFYVLFQMAQLKSGVKWMNTIVS